MIETNAILLTDAYKDYATFRSSIKTFMVTNLSFLLDIDSENSFETNYQKSYDYVMQTIYNYYSNYYLMSGLIEDFERLFSTAISGKLPEWQVAFTHYLSAKSENYKSVSGSTHTGSSTLGATSDTLNKSAQTPEDIGTSADYIDNYSTSEQKYHTTKNDTASSNLNIDNTGSPKDLWENIKNIPQKINKEVIALVGKYFFSEGDEEMTYPLAYLTLTQKMKDLQSAKLLSHTLTMTADYSLKSYIETEGTDFTANLDFKPYILDEMIISYDNTQNHIVLNWTLKDGTSNETSVSLPQVTANYDGLMIKTDKVKLDGLIPFALTFVAHDDYYPVQLDSSTNSLYVRVPKGSIPFASETQAGVVQLFTAPTTDEKSLTPYTDGLLVPIETDANHKMFANVPNYILPLASSTARGGIKADSKASTDTYMSKVLLDATDEELYYNETIPYFTTASVSLDYKLLQQTDYIVFNENTITFRVTSVSTTITLDFDIGKKLINQLNDTVGVIMYKNTSTNTYLYINIKLKSLIVDQISFKYHGTLSTTITNASITKSDNHYIVSFDYAFATEQSTSEVITLQVSSNTTTIPYNKNRLTQLLYKGAYIDVA